MLEKLTNLQAINFSEPSWLYVYLIIATFLILKKNISINNLLQNIYIANIYKHPNYNILKKILHSEQNNSENTPYLIKKLAYLVITGLLFLALSGPYKTGEQLPIPPDNRDIMFVVDNEVSMVLKDYFIGNKRIERLTMVKSVLTNFANKLSGNRMGIITFSENAHTLVPYTTDTNLIKQMIPRIESTLTGRTSNPQNALIYTLNTLYHLNNKKNTAKKSSIILITDILRPPRDIDPNIVAKYIKKQGYKLFVIGIGASTYKKEDIENSTLIYHPASFNRLKQIADYAGGEFYWAKNTDSLENIIRDITNTEKSKISIQPEYIIIPLFQWPLALALLFILLGYLMTIIGKQERERLVK